MKLIAILVLACLSGCASVQQAINGYAAAVSARQAEDENIRIWTADACATPYSAAIRNPQVIPALRDLCGSLIPPLPSDIGIPK